ncbi:DUF1501 domain-containing protein [Singulisphaera rosea]
MRSTDQGTSESNPDVTRRDFLRMGSLGALGLSLADRSMAEGLAATSSRSVILLMMVGGPSQLETFDPKPDAPLEVRGPFSTIATAIPGVRINEHLPRLARRMDRLSLIRSLRHDSAPIHETGQQLVQTGRLCRPGEDHLPHFGSVVSRLGGAPAHVPSFVILPGPIGSTGVDISHGQSAGPLGSTFDPVYHDPELVTVDPDNVRLRRRGVFDLSAEHDSTRESYGRTRFGTNCLLARRLVESGVRVVTVNMYQTVFKGKTWDCHGRHPFSTLDDYANDVLPTFDLAFSALIDDLERRGLLESTLVIATGEFGRTPTAQGTDGRDHNPEGFTMWLAGGGVKPGFHYGATDEYGYYAVDQKMHIHDLHATLLHLLGLDHERLTYRYAGRDFRLTDVSGRVAHEIFA